jgi:hypothetical protein
VAMAETRGHGPHAPERQRTRTRRLDRRVAPAKLKSYRKHAKWRSRWSP